MEEKIYTVPLSKAYTVLRTKRARKAINLLKSFTARHMKVDEENVKISAGVNSLIWRQGIQKPPRKIKVKMVKEEEGGIQVVKVMLLDEKWKVIEIHYPEEEAETPKPKKEKNEKKVDEKPDKKDVEAKPSEKSKEEKKKVEEKIDEKIDEGEKDDSNTKG